MIFDLIPYKSCGPLSGMDTYAQVKQKAGSDYSEFKKTVTSDFVTSELYNSSMHVYYNKNGECKGVEVFRPHSLVREGFELLDTKLVDIITFFDNSGIDYKFIDYGIECDLLGIRIYCNDYENDPNVNVDAVYVQFDINR